MNPSGTEVTAVTETRLTHDLHRRATTLLSEAALRSSVPHKALDELRIYLVKNLHHHHETEDSQLWPMILEAAPEVASRLASLSEEHHHLDAALDALESAPITDRENLHLAAEQVRILVHRHLEHEEPVLFPALTQHVSAQSWADFSQQVIATSPMESAHLTVGFFDEVGTAEEVALILSGLPEAAREFVPAMREQARADLAVLSGTAGN